VTLPNGAEGLPYAYQRGFVAHGWRTPPSKSDAISPADSVLVISTASTATDALLRQGVDPFHPGRVVPGAIELTQTATEPIDIPERFYRPSAEDILLIVPKSDIPYDGEEHVYNDIYTENVISAYADIQAWIQTSIVVDGPSDNPNLNAKTLATRQRYEAALANMRIFFKNAFDEEKGVLYGAMHYVEGKGWVGIGQLLAADTISWYGSTFLPEGVDAIHGEGTYGRMMQVALEHAGLRNDEDQLIGINYAQVSVGFDASVEPIARGDGLIFEGVQSETLLAQVAQRGELVDQPRTLKDALAQKDNIKYENVHVDPAKEGVVVERAESTRILGIEALEKEYISLYPGRGPEGDKDYSVDGRNYYAVFDYEGRFEAIEVRNAADDLAFMLMAGEAPIMVNRKQANGSFELVPIEDIYSALKVEGQVLGDLGLDAETDFVHADILIKPVIDAELTDAEGKPRKPTYKPRGTISSTINGRSAEGGVLPTEFSANATELWTSDFAQHVNLGLTEDGQYEVVEVRSYNKDKNGDIRIVNGKQQYTVVHKYYDLSNVFRFAAAEDHISIAYYSKPEGESFYKKEYEETHLFDPNKLAVDAQGNYPSPDALALGANAAHIDIIGKTRQLRDDNNEVILARQQVTNKRELIRTPAGLLEHREIDPATGEHRLFSDPEMEIIDLDIIEAKNRGTEAIGTNLDGSIEAYAERILASSGELTTINAKLKQLSISKNILSTESNKIREKQLQSQIKWIENYLTRDILILKAALEADAYEAIVRGEDVKVIRATAKDIRTKLILSAESADSIDYYEPSGLLHARLRSLSNLDAMRRLRAYIESLDANQDQIKRFELRYDHLKRTHQDAVEFLILNRAFGDDADGDDADRKNREHIIDQDIFNVSEVPLRQNPITGVLIVPTDPVNDLPLRAEDLIALGKITSDVRKGVIHGHDEDNDVIVKIYGVNDAGVLTDDPIRVVSINVLGEAAWRYSRNKDGKFGEDKDGNRSEAEEVATGKIFYVETDSLLPITDQEPHAIMVPSEELELRGQIISVQTRFDYENGQAVRDPKLIVGTDSSISHLGANIILRSTQDFNGRVILVEHIDSGEIFEVDLENNKIKYENGPYAFADKRGEIILIHPITGDEEKIKLTAIYKYENGQKLDEIDDAVGTDSVGNKRLRYYKDHLGNFKVEYVGTNFIYKADPDTLEPLNMELGPVDIIKFKNVVTVNGVKARVIEIYKAVGSVAVGAPYLVIGVDENTGQTVFRYHDDGDIEFGLIELVRPKLPNLIFKANIEDGPNKYEAVGTRAIAQVVLGPKIRVAGEPGVHQINIRQALDENGKPILKPDPIFAVDLVSGLETIQFHEDAFGNIIELEFIDSGYVYDVKGIINQLTIEYKKDAPIPVLPQFIMNKVGRTISVIMPATIDAANKPLLIFGEYPLFERYDIGDLDANGNPKVGAIPILVVAIDSDSGDEIVRYYQNEVTKLYEIAEYVRAGRVNDIYKVDPETYLPIGKPILHVQAQVDTIDFKGETNTIVYEYAIEDIDDNGKVKNNAQPIGIFGANEITGKETLRFYKDAEGEFSIMLHMESGYIYHADKDTHVVTDPNPFRQALHGPVIRLEGFPNLKHRVIVQYDLDNDLNIIKDKVRVFAINPLNGRESLRLYADKDGKVLRVEDIANKKVYDVNGELNIGELVDAEATDEENIDITFFADIELGPRLILTGQDDGIHQLVIQKSVDGETRLFAVDATNDHEESYGVYTNSNGVIERIAGVRADSNINAIYKVDEPTSKKILSPDNVDIELPITVTHISNAHIGPVVTVKGLTGEHLLIHEKKFDGELKRSFSIDLKKEGAESFEAYSNSDGDIVRIATIDLNSNTGKVYSVAKSQSDKIAATESRKEVTIEVEPYADIFKGPILTLTGSEDQHQIIIENPLDGSKPRIYAINLNADSDNIRKESLRVSKKGNKYEIEHIASGKIFTGDTVGPKLVKANVGENYELEGDSISDVAQGPLLKGIEGKIRIISRKRQGARNFGVDDTGDRATEVLRIYPKALEIEYIHDDERTGTIYDASKIMDKLLSGDIKSIVEASAAVTPEIAQTELGPVIKTPALDGTVTLHQSVIRKGQGERIFAIDVNNPQVETLRFELKLDGITILSIEDIASGYVYRAEGTLEEVVARGLKVEDIYAQMVEGPSFIFKNPVTGVEEVHEIHIKKFVKSDRAIDENRIPAKVIGIASGVGHETWSFGQNSKGEFIQAEHLETGRVYNVDPSTYQVLIDQPHIAIVTDGPSVNLNGKEHIIRLRQEVGLDGEPVAGSNPRPVVGVQIEMSATGKVRRIETSRIYSTPNGDPKEIEDLLDSEHRIYPLFVTKANGKADIYTVGSQATAVSADSEKSIRLNGFVKRLVEKRSARVEKDGVTRRVLKRFSPDFMGKDHIVISNDPKHGRVAEIIENSDAEVGQVVSRIFKVSETDDVYTHNPNEIVSIVVRLPDVDGKKRFGIFDDLQNAGQFNVQSLPQEAIRPAIYSEERASKVIDELGRLVLARSHLEAGAVLEIHKTYDNSSDKFLQSTTLQTYYRGNGYPATSKTYYRTRNSDGSLGEPVLVRQGNANALIIENKVDGEWVGNYQVLTFDEIQNFEESADQRFIGARVRMNYEFNDESKKEIWYEDFTFDGQNLRDIKPSKDNVNEVEVTIPEYDQGLGRKTGSKTYASKWDVETARETIDISVDTLLGSADVKYDAAGKEQITITNEETQLKWLQVMDELGRKKAKINIVSVAGQDYLTSVEISEYAGAYGSLGFVKYKHAQRYDAAKPIDAYLRSGATQRKVTEYSPEKEVETGIESPIARYEVNADGALATIVTVINTNLGSTANGEKIIYFEEVPVEANTITLTEAERKDYLDRDDEAKREFAIANNEYYAGTRNSNGFLIESNKEWHHPTTDERNQDVTEYDASQSERKGYDVATETILSIKRQEDADYKPYTRTTYPVELSALSQSLGFDSNILPAEVLNELGQNEISSNTPLQAAYTEAIGAEVNHWTHYRLPWDLDGRIIASDFGRFKFVAYTWDGRDTTSSAKLTNDGQVMALNTFDTTVQAETIITADLINEYQRVFNADLWLDLANLGITKETLIKRIKVAKRLREKDAVNYGTDVEPLSYAYYLPNDTRERALYVTDGLTKDVSLNMWWGIKGDDINQPPSLTILPASITLKSKILPNEEPSTRRYYDRLNEDGKPQAIFRLDGDLSAIEEESLFNGALTRKKIHYVSAWFAGAPLFSSGLFGNIYYDSKTPHDRPIYITIRENGHTEVAAVWIKQSIPRQPNDYYRDVMYVREPLVKPLPFLESMKVTGIDGEIYTMSGRVRQIQVRQDERGTYVGEKVVNDPTEISFSTLAAYSVLGTMILNIIIFLMSRIGKSQGKRDEVNMNASIDRIIDQSGSAASIDSTAPSSDDKPDTPGSVRMAALDTLQQSVSDWTFLDSTKRDELRDEIGQANTRNNQIQSSEASGSKKQVDTANNVADSLTTVTLAIQEVLYADLIKKKRKPTDPDVPVEISNPLRGHVRRIAKGWGANFLIPNHTLTFDQFIVENPRQSAEMVRFLGWLDKAEYDSETSKKIKTLFKEHFFLAVILMEIIEDETGHHYRSEASSVRYTLAYQLFDRIINDPQNARGFVGEIVTYREKIFKFLNMQYGDLSRVPYYFTKDKRLTHEDMDEVFATQSGAERFMTMLDNEGAHQLILAAEELKYHHPNPTKDTLLSELIPDKKRYDKGEMTPEEKVEFRTKIKERVEKLDEIRSEIVVVQKKLIDEFKPKMPNPFSLGLTSIPKDKVGLSGFLANMWMPFTLLVTAVLASAGIPTWYMIQAPDVSAVTDYTSLLGVVSAISAIFTISMFGLTKLFKSIEVWRGGEALKKGAGAKSNSGAPFWSFYGIVLFVGFIANFFLNLWNGQTIAKFLELPGYVPLTGFALPILIISLLFSALTYVAIGQLTSTIFSIFFGSKIGVGKVRSLESAQKQYAEARQRYVEVNAASPESDSGKQDSFDEIWERTIKSLHDTGDIDEEAAEWLRTWKEGSAPEPIAGFFSEEAEARIKRAVQGWKMNLPNGLPWNYQLPVTVASTAFNEGVWWKLGEWDEGVWQPGLLQRVEEIKDKRTVNGKEVEVVISSGEHLVLNYFIQKYKTEWEIFVDEVLPNMCSACTASNLTNDIDTLRDLEYTDPLPQSLLRTKGFQEAVENWVNQRGWGIGNTLVGMNEIRESWKTYARLQFPFDPNNETKAEYEANVEDLVNQKLQLFLNYEGYGVNFPKPVVSPVDKQNVTDFLDRFPWLEIWWSDANWSQTTDNKVTDTGSTNHVVGPPYNPKGKAPAQAAAFSGLWGPIKYLTDANAPYEVEEAARLPYAYSKISEYVAGSHDYVLFAEDVFPKRFSAQARSISTADETWTNVFQRFLKSVKGLFFYGHNAWSYRAMIKAVNAIPVDYPSEDIVFVMRLMIKDPVGEARDLAEAEVSVGASYSPVSYGDQVGHDETVRGKKNRPTSFAENMGPFGKYPAGAMDLGRVLGILVRSPNIGVGTIISLAFTLGIYLLAPAVVIVWTLYLGWVDYYGVSQFVAYPALLTMGILGALSSQATTAQGWRLQVEGYGFIRGTLRFVAFIPVNYLIHVPYQLVYAISDVVGLLGFAKFPLTAKGINTGWLTLDTIYPKNNGRVMLATTIIAATLAMATIVLTPFKLRGAPLVFFGIMIAGALIPNRTTYDSIRDKTITQFTRELWPEDKTQVSREKLSITTAIAMMLPVAASFFIWRAEGLLWSLPYMGVPISILFTFLYFQPVLKDKIKNHLAPKVAIGATVLASFGVMGWLMGMTGITIVGIGVVAIAIYPFTIADAPNWVRTSPYRWVRNLQKYLWVYGPLDYRGLSKKSTTTSVAAVIPDTDSGEAVIDSDSSEEAASRMGLDQFETALKVQWDAAFANGYGSVFGFDDEKRRRFETPSRKDANSDYSLLLAIADGKLRTPVWKSLDRVDLNQPLSGFNLSMVDSSEILIPEVSIAGQVWKLIINKSPLTRYHSLLIPNEVENQFFRASDAQAMAQLVNQTEFSTVYHSLWGGASVNSKHIQLLSEIAPHLTHLVANGVSNWTSVNEVSIGRPQDSPIIALKSDSPEELGKALWTLINILQEQNLPFSINGYRNHIFVAPTRNDQPSPDLYLGADGIVNTFVMRDLAKFSAPMNELVALMKSVQSQGWVSVETSQDLVAEFLIDSARMAELTEQELELLAAMGIDANTPGALLDYATGLIGAFREFDGETELQILSQDGKTGNFIPSALLPGTGYESALPIVKYADIPKDRKSLADVKLIDYTIMENGGGVGQELLRKRYVAKRGRNTLASKGFDLAFENIPYQGHIINVSVAESKLMAALTAHGQKDAYYKSHYQALVGKGSEASYEALYDLIYLPHRFDNTLSDDDKMSYRQYAESIGFDLMPLDPELPIPSIDIETNELTDAITSSGNHGRVAFSMILGAIDVNISEEERASGIHRITGFANGAGFNDSLNPEVATWMRRERIPIMMVVTVRTPTDANAGGIIGIQTFDDEINGAQARPQILEVAQARASGQFDRFKKIGLAEDEGASEGQVFNTNLGATNTTLLNLILNDLINDGVVTREDITKIITPDLIIRTKTDADGKPYYQFEGAFASSLLNLNAFFMNNERAKEILIRHTGSDKLITMVLTTSKERNDLFNLTKHSSDFWFQAYSRKFRYDTNIWGLKTNTPDIRMPAFELDGLVLDEDEAVDGEGKPKKKRAKNTKIYNYYDELQNVIDALGEKANAAELLSLTIKSNKLAELRTALTKEKIIYEKLHFRIHAAKRTIAILAESLPGSDDPELVKVQISAVRKLITEYKQSSNRSATKLEAAKRKLIDQGLGLGLVNIKDAVLVGEVEIISEYQGEVDLNDYALPKMEVDGQDHLLLSNIRVTIDKKGNVTYETIGARLSGTLPELKQAPRMSIFTPEDELLLEKMGLKADNQKAILAYVEGLVAAYREYDPNKALSIVFEGFDDGNLIPTSMLEGTGYEDTISRKAYAELPKDLESLNESEFIDYMMMVLDGGLGTSVRRKLYLSEQTGQSLDEIELGAKGTDFAFENVEFNGQLIKVSIAEAKLLAALHNSQDYLQVHYEPLVSEDSGPSYKALYDDTILPHRYDDSIPIEEKLTYRQYAKSLGFDLRDFVEELPIPTIDAETDQLTDAKTAPGSHGRVGASLVINALDEDIPASELEAGIHRISSFFNGDGINNAPN
ncbi:MAG: hypothetical protein ACI9Y8_001400, partial [Candidatus Omnitrophota bacterium]